MLLKVQSILKIDYEYRFLVLFAENLRQRVEKAVPHEA